MMKKTLLLFVLLIAVPCLRAQATAPQGIEDNSFLIEEAYNQEKGVIQYISTFYRSRNGDFVYNFTNEFPVGGQRHQFSYGINIAGVNGQDGLGDTFLNYRYQLHGMKESDRVAIAPRFSLIVPTGSYRRGSGSGALGFQTDLAVSVIHTKKIVTHWNAGSTIIPRARDTAGDRADTVGFNLGQSTVYLFRNNLNFLVETVWNRVSTVTARGRTVAGYTLLVNPGIRWAWNFKSGLQIVPGLAVPIGVGPSYGEHAMFLYLSFEK